jgi:hypothetical protein
MKLAKIDPLEVLCAIFLVKNGWKLSKKGKFGIKVAILKIDAILKNLFL